VPSSCDPGDVASAANSTALKFQHVEVLVENDMCQVKRIPKKSTDFDWVRFWVAIFILMMSMFGQGAICTPDELDRMYNNCFLSFFFFNQIGSFVYFVL